MTDSELLTFLLRALRATAFDFCDIFFWRTDGEYAPVSLFVKCNDLFYWGCADGEPLTPNNIHLLEQSIADCKAADPKFGYPYAPELFCCRARGERPQGCCYPENRDLWPLFDACGPERAVGLGNPYSPESYWEEQRKLREEKSKS